MAGGVQQVSPKPMVARPRVFKRAGGLGANTGVFVCAAAGMIARAPAPVLSVAMSLEWVVAPASALTPPSEAWLLYA